MSALIIFLCPTREGRVVEKVVFVDICQQVLLSPYIIGQNNIINGFLMIM